MDVEKEEMEQLKRDLYTYGYYLSRLKWYDSKLKDIQLRIQDNYEASGIRYDDPMGSGDPYHPTVVALILEESKLLSEKHQVITKKNALGLESKLDVLKPQEYTIIECTFFYKHTHGYVASVTGLSREGVTKKINRCLKKMIKK